jgi:hypothetical protein
MKTTTYHPSSVPTADKLLESLGWSDGSPTVLDSRFRRAYEAFLKGNGYDPDYAELPSAISQAGWHLTRNDPVASVKRERDEHHTPATMHDYFDAWWLLVLHLVGKAATS